MVGPIRSVSRVWWLILPALDVCLLVYLVLSYHWFAHEAPDASNSPGAIIIYPIAYAIIGLVTILELGFVVVIGAGIARQFRLSWLSSRWFGLVVPIPAMGLLMAVTVWAFLLRPIAAIRGTARVDRFEVFWRLAEDAGTYWHPPGLVEGGAVSFGLVLALLLGIAYLAEKYSLAWLHVRWPVPLTPIALVAWLGWIVTTGEQAQREFVNLREWRAVAESQTYPQAVQECGGPEPDAHVHPAPLRRVAAPGGRQPQRERLRNRLARASGRRCLHPAARENMRVDAGCRASPRDYARDVGSPPGPGRRARTVGDGVRETRGAAGQPGSRRQDVSRAAGVLDLRGLPGVGEGRLQDLVGAETHHPPSPRRRPAALRGERQRAHLPSGVRPRGTDRGLRRLRDVDGEARRRRPGSCV